MSRKVKVALIALSISTVFFFFSTATLLLNRYAPQYFAIDNSLENEVDGIIKSDYLRDYPSDDRLEEAQARALVYALGDDYSYYMDEQEAQDFENSLNEKYEGIGVAFDLVGEDYVISSVFSSGPASNAGVQVGDVLKKIGDREIDDFEDFEDIANAIKGASGTSVDLTFLRDGQTKFFSIKRESVSMDLVSLEFVDNVAVVTITSFGNGLDQKMNEIAHKITENKDVDKIIIDLRNNSGGLLDQSLDVASYFIGPKKVVTIEKDKDNSQPLRSSDKDVYLENYQLVVLTDKYTASAAEILTAALKDYKDATIVGQKTFGKGTVQQIYDLKNGGVLKLTIANWLTSKGVQIDKIGIEPDIKVRTVKDTLQTVLQEFDWNTKTLKSN